MAERILAWTFGIVFCVAIPAFVTAIAPISKIDLSRQGPHVSAKITNYLLLAIPMRTTTMEQVVQVDDEFQRGKTYVETANYSGRSRRQTERSEDESYLVLTGPNASLKVPVSPVNIDTVKLRSQQFLIGPEPTALRLWTVANWKFSILAGVPLTLLALLFLCVVAWKAVMWPVRILCGEDQGPGRIAGGDLDSQSG